MMLLWVRRRFGVPCRALMVLYGLASGHRFASHRQLQWTRKRYHQQYSSEDRNDVPFLCQAHAIINPVRWRISCTRILDACRMLTATECDRWTPHSARQTTRWPAPKVRIGRLLGHARGSLNAKQASPLVAGLASMGSAWSLDAIPTLFRIAFMAGRQSQVIRREPGKGPTMYR